MSKTREEVEGILLNSSEDPRVAVYEALQAVAQFAYLELGCIEEQLLNATRAAFQQVSKL